MSEEVDQRIDEKPEEPEEPEDKQELENLLCEHYQFVVNLTRAIGVDRDYAEDVANEAMINAYEALDKLREPEKIKSWLRTIVKNEAKAFYAQKKKRREIDEALRMEAGNADLADLSEFAAGEAVFREMMQRAEAAEFAKEIMDRLSPLHRSIMYMRFWGGYTFIEIGEILDIKPSTARCMYTRCRQRLCVRYAYVNGKEADRHDKRKKYAHLYDE